MGVFKLNSFGHYTTTAQADTKVARGAAPIAGTGAFGAAGIVPLGFGGEIINLDRTLTEIEVSIWIKFSPQYGIFFECRNTFGPQFSLAVFSDGTIKAYLAQPAPGGIDTGGGGGMIIATSDPGVVQFGEHHHYRIQAVLSQTVGTISVLIDNLTEAFDGAGTFDNCYQAAANCTQIVFHGDGQSNIASAVYSHLAIADTVGDIIGTPRVECVFADGAGNYQQWNNTGGATHVDSIDEVTPNEDTDYVSESVVGDRESFTFQNFLASVDQVLAVQLVARVRKDDASARTVKLFTREGGVDFDQTEQGVPGAYGYLLECLAENPATTNPWTAAEINAIEAGIKVQA